MQKLAKDQLVDGFEYSGKKEVCFCKSCVDGKHHRTRFPVSEHKGAKEPLDFVHSDVCGKFNENALIIL